MFSINLRVLLISAKPEHFEQVRDELKEHPVELSWYTSYYAVSSKAAADIVILETLELEVIERVKLLLAGIPVVLLHSNPDYQWGLAAIREGAAEYLTVSEIGSGALFRTLRFCFERAKVERAVEQSQAQLVAAQRMEAIGRTVAGVAHDFRHFLQVVYGNCSLMKKMSHSPAFDEMIDEIKGAGERANILIKQMLEFAQGSPARETLLDLNQTIETFRALYKNVLSPGVTVEYRLCEQPLQVYLDCRIEQVLMNLIINASDAIGEQKGSIFVETKILSLDRDYLDRWVSLSSGIYVVLEVSDTGQGIHPSNLDRIFEPFFTTKPRDIGTGLGLSTVFTLVQEWKGVIAVASIPEKGTTFKLIFPGPAQALAPALAPPKVTGLKVAIGDHDEPLQLILRRDLSSLGCEVRKVENQQVSLRIDDATSRNAGLQICELSPGLTEYLEIVEQDTAWLSIPYSRAELAGALSSLSSHR